ncbi:hypothetical protein FRC08_005572 [Ceratobasidium sp. 394]|nr:hypothetical protein FRC08_005572 [Ceratobasidium sp. 394]
MTKRPPESLRTTPTRVGGGPGNTDIWQFPASPPLTRLCSDTSFAQPLVPLSDSDSDGSDLELDLDGDSVIRDFGIDHDVEILDADPDDGRAQSAEDDEGDES